LRNADSFDPIQIGRYSVIRAHWHFPPDEAKSKLFIVLRHVVPTGKEPLCVCLKPTSQADYYERNPEQLKGVVIYPKGAIPIPAFTKQTFIDPSSHREIAHSYLHNEAVNRRYKVEGVMPSDFHLKLANAITNSMTLPPKTIKLLLQYIGM
jgi:hypothetical protein